MALSFPIGSNTGLGWRNHISREAFSGSLESFPPATWQLGTGAAESISKTKLPRLTDAKNRSAELARATENQVKNVRTVLAQPTAKRLSLHVAVASAITLVVVAGSSASSHQASLINSPAGLGSVLDEASAANVAAVVAAKTNLTIASDANQTASALSAQISLPTSSSDFLNKRQAVATSGADQHTIINYSVADGDTLSGIAAKFNVTTATIKWANNLTDSDNIKPGQALTILPISGLLYTVQGGDTADSLAAKYQSNAAQILSFNDAEVKGLTPGQQIIIPDGVKADAPAAKAATNIAIATSGRNSRLLPRLAFSGNGYAYGYCTYYVASRRYVPSNWGNAAAWYYNAKASGYAVGSAPAAGAIAWTSGGYYGHVAYVEGVSGGMVTVSEMNYNGGWNHISSRTVPASEFRYIY
ncbi:MAG TPA: LysM peptidoglycan-binding domain-containing protein [Candidatus Saccharimonadales bacterium]|nr:LysM peptidoglycan-binding domain-containing protein [Candidatus Saccharimonadales bacterium]